MNKTINMVLSGVAALTGLLAAPFAKAQTPQTMPDSVKSEYTISCANGKPARITIAYGRYDSMEDLPNGKTVPHTMINMLTLGQSIGAKAADVYDSKLDVMSLYDVGRGTVVKYEPLLNGLDEVYAVGKQTKRHFYNVNETGLVTKEIAAFKTEALRVCRTIKTGQETYLLPEKLKNAAGKIAFSAVN